MKLKLLYLIISRFLLFTYVRKMELRYDEANQKILFASQFMCLYRPFMLV